MKGGGGQQQGNSSMDFLWICAGLVIGVGLLWYNFSTHIVSVFFVVRYWEARFIELVMVPVLVVAHVLHLPAPDLQPLDQALRFVRFTSPGSVTFQQLADVSADIGQYLAVPGVLIGAPMALYLVYAHASAKFKNTYNMDSLRRLEVENWPMIAPVVETNLVKTDLDEGVWAMSKQPMDFAKQHDLLEKYTKEGRPAVKVIPGRAHRIFSLQMGPLWSGLEGLPPHMQALFAVFAAKAEQDAKAVEKLLRQLSESAAKGKLDCTGVRELLIKHVRARSVGRAVGPHAYVLTVMASMLELARTDGVLATAEFLWLKTIDRRLWYMLNCVGRQTPFAEAAGPFGHWLIEKRLRRPLKVPMVGEAVIALDLAIEDILYNPDEM